MLTKIFNKGKRCYKKKVDGIGLAIFRIFYSIVLLLEIGQLFYFRHLVYDKIPYLEVSEIEFAIPLLLWALSVFFILVGYQTRIAALINYILSLVCIGTISSYEYHMFYAYMGINFLLIFIPVSRCISLDSLLSRFSYTDFYSKPKSKEEVSILSYYLILLVGVGFVYFDSILFKLVSENWMSGLGMWLPANLPMITHFDSSWMMNQKSVVLFLGYFTIVFEFLFIFLFWFKKFRVPLFIIGMGLHLGILIEFPIPWFALGMIAVYLLLVPNSFWRKYIFKKKKIVLIYLESFFRKTPLKYIINKVENSPNKVTQINTSYDDFKFNLIMASFVSLILMQIMVSYSSPLIIKFRKEAGFHNTSLDILIRKCSSGTKMISHRLLGITNHGVFMDNHFDNYNHIIAITYENNDGAEEWLPIIRQDGTVGNYLYGFNWVKWSWRVNAPDIENKNLEKGIRDFTAFWAEKNQVDLIQARFNILVKRIEIPEEWKKDFLKNQMKKPWIKGGSVEWINYNFVANIKEIESM